MNERSCRGCWLGAVAFATFVFSSTAFSQTLIDGQDPLDNVTVAAIGERSPGNLVSDGTFRLSQSGGRPGEITETPQSSIGSLLLADSIDIVFEQFNQAIVLLQGLLIARAGGTPALPAATSSRQVKTLEYPSESTFRDSLGSTRFSVDRSIKSRR